MRQRRYADSRRHLEYAIQRNPTDPRAHFNLALTLERLAEKDAARAAMREAVHLDPAFRHHPDAQRLLQPDPE